MANIIGIFCIAVGLWQLWGALQRRSQVAAGTAVLRPPAKLDAAGRPSLQMMGEIMPPIILAVLVLFGLKMTALYFLLGGGEYFSLLDLGGLLFLLASYGYWLVMHTKYRELKPGELQPAMVTATDGRIDERQSAVPGGSAAFAGRGDGVGDLATAVAASAEGRKGGQEAA
jgi:hypothetical protein